MDVLDPLVLSRIQFAANISFHILFPTITIALGWVLVFFKFRFAATGDAAWMRAYFFWVKVFALSFAMGVVSGITMSFQFGTNWPGFMNTVGNIAGPLLAYEVLTAFFLEAAFVGIMLFGYSRVPGWAHTGATVIVALGTTVSAFWIIALNSWMHTPQGFEMRDGVAHATDWAAIVFNPSMPYRLAHMLLASGLTVAFLLLGLSALRRLWGDRSDEVRRTLVTGAVLGASLIPVQIFMGDMHGLNTLEHQPAKVAAMEGNWETGPNTPLLLFALPDEAARENRLELAIPNLASIILTHHADGVVPGLNDFVAEDGTVLHPPVGKVFWSFRVMVGTGLGMLALSWATVLLLRRRGVDGLPTPVLLAAVPMALSGWVATLAGWYTTEIGRQPWLVQGVLTTEAAVGDVAGGMVAGTLIAYLAVYAALMLAYVGAVLHLARKASAQGGPSAPQGPLPLPAE
ncbi:cytochrome ubiquinol oxidase subunit I [Meridianimarinicoccus roseus]|uniref:Cytochrome ubiquinol oxidase subunit I n=1 Tax=Meridianimarinicoccus roseus TaxID=2072018 RepID=A0A2V2LF50_9RHOB|nr:cytochrome ubiquinol oxidase subunit I [Meridianimarinicoccus roseus]PWR03652.1 cytochrome ubiquinol oxidase subunit I [Meridianimarinicoccus roseus]